MLFAKLLIKSLFWFFIQVGLSNKITLLKFGYYRGEWGGGKDKFPVDSFIKHSNQVTPDTVKELSQYFNQYFASVGSQLAEATSSRGPAVLEDAQHATDAVFEPRPVTRQEIINTVLPI